MAGFDGSKDFRRFEFAKGNSVINRFWGKLPFKSNCHYFNRDDCQSLFHHCSLQSLSELGELSSYSLKGKNILILPILPVPRTTNCGLNVIQYQAAKNLELDPRQYENNNII